VAEMWPSASSSMSKLVTTVKFESGRGRTSAVPGRMLTSCLSYGDLGEFSLGEAKQRKCTLARNPIPYSICLPLANCTCPSNSKRNVGDLQMLSSVL